MKIELRVVGKQEQAAQVFEGKPIEFMPQKHTNEIVILEKNAPRPEAYDGIIATQPGAYGIYTADCVPVVINFGKGVALLHAGWKGLSSGIIAKAFELIKRQFKVRKADCEVYVFPHISTWVYRIVPLEDGGDGRENIFRERYGVKSMKMSAKGNWYLDLKYCVLKEIRGTKAIHYDTRCTYQTPSFPSYYQSKTTDRLLTIVSI